VAKKKISVIVDAAVLAEADADADAKTAGPNRSEMIEHALRNEHLRRALHMYTTRIAPALNIDTYAEQISEANRPQVCGCARRHRSAPGQ
jgi:metal-responsive CopG/Arc/MetJ family transcriptional regulator